jgi:hypothetical protein
VQVIKTLTGTSCIFAVPFKTVPFWIKHCRRFCDVVSGFTWTLCLLTWIRSRGLNLTGRLRVRSSSTNLMGGDHLRDLSIDGGIIFYIRKCAYHVTLMGFPIFAQIARRGKSHLCGAALCLDHLFHRPLATTYFWYLSPKRRNISHGNPSSGNWVTKLIVAFLIAMWTLLQWVLKRHREDVVWICVDQVWILWT